MSKFTFPKSAKKIFWYAILLFIILFAFRLGYGYTKKVPEWEINNVNNISNNFNFSGYLNRNFASAKFEKGGMAQQSPSKPSVDQKYEKVADITTKSDSFSEDEKKARDLIKKQEAIIQYENKNGNDGNRSVQLIIGVPPSNFDALFKEMIQIGFVISKSITKKDKTNEYKELNARRVSLEKTRNSLIALKDNGGKIEEFMQLENRILEVESKLQDLGVSLGDFDAENEFCTVRFGMTEGKKNTISFMHRVKVALEWTVKIFFRLVTSLFFAAGGAYLVVLVFQLIKKLFNR